MERCWPKSLRIRLTALVLLAVIPAATLVTYSAIERQQRAAYDAQQAALTIARLAAFEQTLVISGVRHLLSNVAHFPSVRTRESAHCGKVLADLLKPQPFYANIGAADADGNVWCSGHPFTTRVSIADRTYFRRALATGDFAVGEYQVGRITGKPSINFAYPVRDDRNHISGVVYTALDVSWLNQFVARAPLPAGAVMTVIDTRGTVLARSPDPENWVGNALPDPAQLGAILHADPDHAASFSGMDGIPRILASVPLILGARGGAFVSIAVPEAIAFAEARRILVRDLAVLAAMAALVLAIAWFGGDVFVLRRVRALSTAAARLGSGDLAARTNLPHSDGELGQLASQFDAMADALQLREQNLHTASHEIQCTNRALKVLSAGNQALLRADNEETLLADICRVAVAIGGYRLAWVGFAETDDEKTVRSAAIAGADGGYVASLDLRWSDTDRGRGPVGTALRTGRRVVVRDIGTDPSFALWRTAARAHGFASMVAFPFRIDNVVGGTLAIYSDEPDAFDETELGLLDEMSQDLAYGITMLRARARHRAAEEKIERLAYYDNLTGLPNYPHLIERVREAMDQARRERQSFALLAVNLDRFKEINDALGFEQGDALLSQIAPRLRQTLGDGAFIARIHGDAFGILVAGASAELAEDAARNVQAAMRTPFVLNGVPLDAPVTVGIVLFPGHGDRPEQLIRRADIAMRHARQHGLTQMFYAAGWEQQNPRHLALAGELRQAIDNGWLELHYQPKVDLRETRVCGVEALARWQHPQLGNVAPDEFIRIAEHTGLIRPLTDWILEAAMQQSHAWKLQGIHLPVAVNLSVRNLHDPALLDKVRGLMAAWDIGTGQLEFEITESAIMEDPEHVFQVLAFLHELGIGLFIDDFGTGYSSLSYLKNLPVDALKIDKSFTRDMLDDKGSALIVSSTIELAHNLNLKVVAEGVESQAMYDHLRTMGCDAAQGYHIARPVPPGLLLDWLQGSAWGNGRNS
jgi:diguanylate cyclase